MHNPLSVYLVLGTNEGNRLLNLEKALELISTIPDTCILKKSKPYKSEAYGPVKQPFYLNQAVKVETELSSENLLNQTESIEIKMGRKNKTRAKRHFEEARKDRDWRKMAERKIDEILNPTKYEK